MTKRIVTGVLVGSAWLFCLCYMPGWMLFGVLLLMSCACQNEFYQMMRRNGHPVSRNGGMAMGVVWLTACYAFPPYAARELPMGHQFETLVLAALVFALLLRVLFDSRIARPVEHTGVTLLGFFLLARWLVRSKFGRVLQAVRDAESRVMFSGYSPLPYKLTIWTISAMMCGVAGALYVPQVGIINPGEMSAANSIEIAVWAAVGGRATLIGPIAGAFLVNGAKSWLTVVAPEFWLYFLGGLFIAVTLFLPNGIVGLLRRPQKAVADAQAQLHTSTAKEEGAP